MLYLVERLLHLYSNMDVFLEYLSKLFYFRYFCLRIFVTRIDSFVSFKTYQEVLELFPVV